ncbi:hypothetical protein JD969_00895 [Planctomycetota bacterium]|nr:hypothetical protein JD969_00895 [Planctomycetota bacterium]
MSQHSKSIISSLRFITTTLALITACTLIPSNVHAMQSTSPVYKNNAERWQEHSYGMSLIPPANTTQINNTSDGSLVKFKKSDAYLISVKIIHVDKVVELGDIASTADLKFLYAYPSAVPTKDEIFKINNNIEALQRFLYVPDKEKGDWVFGQTFIKLDPITFGMVDFECKATEFDIYTPIFKEVCNSIRLTSPDELDKQRIELIKNGQKIRESIDVDALASKLPYIAAGDTTTKPNEQWFRLVKNEKEIGYMRMRLYREEQLGQMGIRIEINASAKDGAETISVKQDYFQTTDRQFEVWSTRKTSKNPKQSIQIQTRNKEKEVLPETTSVAITGTRSGNKLTVSIDKDADVRTLEWQIPQEQYISQVGRIFLFSQLPQRIPHDFAYYGFDSTNEKLSLMIGHITPTDSNDGSYWLEFLPGLDASPVYSCYDYDGTLLRQELPDGLILIPSTIEQIKIIHENKK